MSKPRHRFNEGDRVVHVENGWRGRLGRFFAYSPDVQVSTFNVRWDEQFQLPRHTRSDVRDNFLMHEAEYDFVRATKGIS